MSEFQNPTTPTGTQEYDYDRWGNRTIKDTSSAIFNKTQFTVNTANNRLGVASGQPGVMEYDAAGVGMVMATLLIIRSNFKIQVAEDRRENTSGIGLSDSVIQSYCVDAKYGHRPPAKNPYDLKKKKSK